MTHEPILEATDIEHSYGMVPVLEGVTLGVESGAITALLGPNGSGKSTMIRTLVGLQRPDAGTVSYNGPDRRRTIGYLPQRPSFRSGQSVLDTLTFYASLAGEPPSAAMATLERVGLAEAADRDAAALSGGMTRLVGIAQALLGDPPVIVLDEPASGLDPEMSVHIFDVLEELAADGTGILLSSHDLALVERTADEIALLDAGQIVESGPPNAVTASLEADTLLDVFKTAIGGEPGTVRVKEGRYG